MLPALQRVLNGRDSAIVAVPDWGAADTALRAVRAGEPIGDDVALVASTSGTTGAPKGALLTAAALSASAEATHHRLGGPGRWLLALPPYHIAGLQVFVRSILAGSAPVELDVSDGFDVAELPRAVRKLGSGRCYTALVAAQLSKALDDPAAAAALAGLDAVLLGGGPAPQPVLDAASNAGVTVIRTYGMSETAGGCVYDGVPLDGVGLRVRSDGRIVVGGATLASGYRNPVVPDPFTEPGWFVTDDLGALQGCGEAGLLTVFGRVDDAISTGGLTVLPGPVESALRTHPAVADCVVFGVADARLGQRVVAAVVLNAEFAAPDPNALQAHVELTLDRSAAPREVHFLAELPRGGIGKVDRKTLVRRFGTGGVR
ncbi:o-succinylbenzoate--CoA ligase [Mycobacterium sp.]|uniref:o-succinylbenzoate--CoA ligase n=1 Tax=Mycobacterium sp. TaxID=1785 RepID=UPI003A8C34C0